MASGKSNRLISHGLAGGVVLLHVVALWIALSTPVTAADDPLRRLSPQMIADRPAPDFELPDRDGRTHRLSELRGRPVVLNFWTRDCQPCVQELPSLAALAEAGRERGSFSVVTVTIDESWEAVQRLFGDDSELLVLFDPEREVVQGGFNTERFPETFLIDRDGHVRARFDGARDWSSPAVLDAIERL